VKYRAFIDFIHNGVRIKGGEVFDSDVVKFSKEDINFLKEQSKIESAQPLAKPKRLLDEILLSKLEVSEPAPEPVVNEENTVGILIEGPRTPSDSSLFKEDTAIEEVDKVEELEAGFEEALSWEESNNTAAVDIRESELAKLSKVKLVELAEKLNIDTKGKTKRELALEIAKVNG